MDILSLFLVRPKMSINITSDVFHCHAPEGGNLHPLRWSAVMPSHAAFMASNRDIWSCGLLSHTFHLHTEENSSIGFRNEEYGWKELHCYPFMNLSKNGSDCAVGNLHIHAPKLDWFYMLEWLIQIVLQLEVICQFSRHYKQFQCQICI